MRTAPLPRRLLAELLGSMLLAALVIGSGIAAQELSPHDLGLRLFENAAATAAGLYTIILMFGPVSGGHFNPIVSLVDSAFGGLARRDLVGYVAAQIAGCALGALLANAMFAQAAVSISTHHRATPAHLLAEVVATCGLLLVIFSLARTRRTGSAPADGPVRLPAERGPRGSGGPASGHRPDDPRRDQYARPAPSARARGLTRSGEPAPEA